jgi:hypothetical protein
MAGRGLTLNRAKIVAIAAAVNKGLTAREAGIVSGVPSRTVEGWLQIAREGPDTEAGTWTPLHGQLAEAIERAETEHRLKLIAGVEGHAPKSWQAGAWLLERKYGLTKPADVVVHVGRPDAASEEELKDALARRPTRVDRGKP